MGNRDIKKKVEKKPKKDTKKAITSVVPHVPVTVEVVRKKRKDADSRGE